MSQPPAHSFHASLQMFAKHEDFKICSPHYNSPTPGWVRTMLQVATFWN